MSWTIPILAVFGVGALFASAARGRVSELQDRASELQEPSSEPAPRFLTANNCAACHRASPNATALRSADGRDVSPFTTWRTTAMANAFIDPYFLAQFAREREEFPEQAAELEALCLRCHAPAHHHVERAAGRPATLTGASADPMSYEGATCTVCHQTRDEGLGEEAAFDGNLPVGAGGKIFGPYEAPFAMPMRRFTGYEATHGEHISRSSLCASCHTLRTAHAPGADLFLEQSPYLEWRNSVFSDEDGVTASSRTCQQCHMPDEGSMRIARNPAGRDFPPVRPRDSVRSHTFIGANAFLLDLFAKHGEELGATAPPEAFRHAAHVTRASLARDAATIEVQALEHTADGVAFEVRVANLTGHKLPTGYPSRRVWLHVEVLRGAEVVFRSGCWDTEGRLTGIEDELALPHLAEVTEPRQVIVYESVALDSEGRPTTSLVAMASRAKDNRLLPLGWRADGPHAADTAPVGVGDDPDFMAGGDTVRFRVALEPRSQADAEPLELEVRVELLLQTIPPAWVDGLRASRTDEARRFIELYEAADRTPEILARSRRVLAAR